MDVHKEDLARELRLWLKGKMIRNSSIIIPKRIEDNMTRFVKFGKPPLQEDLIMWMLSRAELQWAPNAAFEFGGLGQHNALDHDDDVHNNNNIDTSHINLANSYPLSTRAALRAPAYLDEVDRIQNESSHAQSLRTSLPTTGLNDRNNNNNSNNNINTNSSSKNGKIHNQSNKLGLGLKLE